MFDFLRRSTFYADAFELHEQVCDYVASGRFAIVQDRFAREGYWSLPDVTCDSARGVYQKTVVAIRDILGWDLVEFDRDTSPHKDIDHGTRGLCDYSNRTIYVERGPATAMARLALHETIHAMMEEIHRNNINLFGRGSARRLAEQVAEGAMTIVMWSLGFDVTVISFPYLAGYGFHNASTTDVVPVIEKAAKDLYLLLQEAQARYQVAA